MKFFFKYNCFKIPFIILGVLLSLWFLDPFTVKSIESRVFKGEQYTRSYELNDGVKTGSIVIQQEADD